MQKILYLRNSSASFVQQDLDELTKIYEVVDFVYINKGIFQNLKSQFNLLNLLLKLPKNTIVYTWFADYHAFLPAFLGFNQIVVIGGYDVIYAPKFKYGTFNKPWRKLIVKYILKKATKLLPVSNHILNEMLVNAKNKELQKKSKVVYNAIKINYKLVDYKYYKNRKIDFTCVSLANDIFRYEIKGIDRFIELVKFYPEKNFVLIGVSEKLQKDKSFERYTNLIVYEFIERENLKEILSESKYICQFSRFESFGLALLEGMSFGAIPLTMNNIASKEILEKCIHLEQGIYKEFNCSLIDEYVNQIETHENEIGKISIDVAASFSLENRIKIIKEVINNEKIN